MHHLRRSLTRQRIGILPRRLLHQGFTVLGRYGVWPWAT
jgi:hypothetical protein